MNDPLALGEKAVVRPRRIGRRPTSLAQRGRYVQLGRQLESALVLYYDEVTREMTSLYERYTDTKYKGHSREGRRRQEGRGFWSGHHGARAGSGVRDGRVSGWPYTRGRQRPSIRRCRSPRRISPPSSSTDSCPRARFPTCWPASSPPSRWKKPAPDADLIIETIAEKMDAKKAAVRCSGCSSARKGPSSPAIPRTSTSTR